MLTARDLQCFQNSLVEIHEEIDSMHAEPGTREYEIQVFRRQYLRGKLAGMLEALNVLKRHHCNRQDLPVVIPMPVKRLSRRKLRYLHRAGVGR